MADLTDVQDALVAKAAQILYPGGTGQPSAANIPCMIYAGWPLPDKLEQDLAAGRTHVSIFARPEERNTSRYPPEWKQQALNATTLTLTINGQQITVGGTVPEANKPQNVAVVANGQAFTYAATNADTLASIATALAALISAGIAGTSNIGPVITLPSSARISAARVGGTGTLIRELRRQERLFQITVWADTPDARRKVAELLDVALADTKFLTLADQSAARLIYKNSPQTDQHQKGNLYRRDLFYTVEFATTQTTTATQIIAEQTNLAPQTNGGAQISTVQVNL